MKDTHFFFSFELFCAELFKTRKKRRPRKRREQRRRFQRKPCVSGSILCQHIFSKLSKRCKFKAHVNIRGVLINTCCDNVRTHAHALTSERKDERRHLCTCMCEESRTYQLICSQLPSKARKQTREFLQRENISTKKVPESWCHENLRSRWIRCGVGVSDEARLNVTSQEDLSFSATMW